MKSKIWLIALALLSPCGCANNTQTDALGGGILGAGLGALMAGPRHALAGAAIGGAVGAGTGALVGNSQDKVDQQRKDYAIAAANAQAQRQMSIDEIVQLSQRGTPDDIIIQQISSTGSRFALTSADINYLQDQRVSGRVINYMQVARSRMVVVQPVYVPPPPVYVEPGVSIGVRGRF
jgi:hypothetical protein